jgi:hypothetical protein
MRGTIDQIWENESRNGQKYLTVQIDGERYSVWDTEYFDLIHEGADVECDVRQSGNFKHLVDIRQSNEQHAPVYQPNHRDRQITRLSCLKSASEILAPAQLDTDAKRNLVIDTARFFERYVFEDGNANVPNQETGE